MKRIDLTGKTFGELTVLKYSHMYKRQSFWLCRCSCGKEKIIMGANLKTDNTRSCGCLWEDKNSTHRESKTRLYKIWGSMRSRCCNKNNNCYKNYGDRGITICKEWEDFISFRDWSIKNGYTEELSIDRINNDGNYEPSNCRWTTAKVQSNNRRNTIHIIIDGVSHTISDWSEISGIKYINIINRYDRGDRGEKLLRPIQTNFRNTLCKGR